MNWEPFSFKKYKEIKDERDPVFALWKKVYCNEKEALYDDVGVVRFVSYDKEHWAWKNTMNEWPDFSVVRGNNPDYIAQINTKT